MSITKYLGVNFPFSGVTRLTSHSYSKVKGSNHLLPDGEIQQNLLESDSLALPISFDVQSHHLCRR